MNTYIFDAEIIGMPDMMSHVSTDHIIVKGESICISNQLGKEIILIVDSIGEPENHKVDGEYKIARLITFVAAEPENKNINLNENPYLDSNDPLLDPDYTGIKFEIDLNIPKSSKHKVTTRELTVLYDSLQHNVYAFNTSTPISGFDDLPKSIQKALRKGWVKINMVYREGSKICTNVIPTGEHFEVFIKDYIPSKNAFKPLAAMPFADVEKE